MKHSIIIGLILTVIEKVNTCYEHSLIHALLKSIGGFISMVFEGSLWGRGLELDQGEETFIPRIFQRIFGIWNGLAKKTGRFFKPVLHGSTLYRYVENFETLDTSFLSVGFTLVVFGFFTMLFAIITSRFSMKYSFISFVLGFLFLLFSSGIKEIIGHAKTYPLLKIGYGLFTYGEEEGDDQTQED